MMIFNHPLLAVLVCIIRQEKSRPEEKEERGKRLNMMESDGFHKLMLILAKDRLAERKAAWSTALMW